MSEKKIKITIGEISVEMDADDYEIGLKSYNITDEQEGSGIILTPTQLVDLYLAIKKIKKQEELI